MPLSSLPVLIDPIIVLRLLHHWILSRKIVLPSTTTTTTGGGGGGARQTSVVKSNKVSSSPRHRPTARPAVRRELSLPADERVISRLEAQLLPHVIQLKLPSVRPYKLVFIDSGKKQVDISYVDDDEPVEQVRQDAHSLRLPGEEDRVEDPAEAAALAPPRPPGFNPTEAILATMQLLPLPCAKVGLMTANEIERNVSVIRSYAQGQSGADLMHGIMSAASGHPLRRKSKSQMGLDELRDESGKVAVSSTTAACDLDELRSFQRQLQNFPSLSELRRHPLQNWLASTTANNNRRSLSPATSSRWLEGQQQEGVAGLQESAAIRPPTATGSVNDQPRSSSSRSTSRSSSESRGAHSTESYALAILEILQVRHMSN